MLNVKSFLAVDFGAGTLKLAEFEVNETGGLRLKQYGFKPLGSEGAQDSSREAVIQKALKDLIAEKGIKARETNVCAPGFHVFSKFVKLPPVDAGKVGQIIEYEAKSNVPFPLDEVVWDYQILGSAGSGELEVLLVAIKADVVEGLFKATESANLRLELTDVSPAALCNAFRYNYGELEDCTMLLDIGAKTSNLLFFEKGKMFSRSINLGANSITQDFANESKKKFDVAEKTKIEEGFVSLGGAYEEPENPDQAAISKIARQFMTRLHIQVNQTMQFYRGQQGGSAPQRLFLSGGASVMPYTAQFFAEKLNVPVEYFNPLRNVAIDPAINLEDLQRVAHSMGEVVGLGLRNLAHCPVELNLMPESTLRWQSFNQKKPYFIATVFSLVLVVAAMGWLFAKLASVKETLLEDTHRIVVPDQEKREKFKKVLADQKKATGEMAQIVSWMEQRYFWADFFAELRQVMIRAEGLTRSKLQADTGIWIEKFTSSTAREGEMDANGQPSGGPSQAERQMLDPRYRERPPMPPPPPADGGAPVGITPATPSDGSQPPVADAAAAGGISRRPKTNSTNELATVRLQFRGVSQSKVSAEANKDTAYAVLQELKNSPMIDPDPEVTKFSGVISQDEPPGTFTFEITVGLKIPLKL